MKILDIHRPKKINEESWADIAKAAYAGAVGQKDLFGKDDNKYNAEIEKSKAGEDWLIKNFSSQANADSAATPDDYRNIAKQLLNKMLVNQTGTFQNLLVTLGLKNKPNTNITIDTFINDIKNKFGNDLRALPELGRALDSLGKTYDDILVRAAEHRPGSIDPALQRLMAGFSAIWYNLPKIMKDAIDRNIQSSRYGERWIDAGNGIEIKPASVYDSSTQARYNNEIFFYDNRSHKWTDNIRQPLDAQWQISLNQALKNAGIPGKHTGAPPDQQKTDADQTTGSGLVIPASPRKRSPQQQAALQTPAAQQPVMIKGRSGREFQYNDKDKTWSTAGEIISDPRIIQHLYKLALPQFQNRAMGLKTRGAQNDVFS